MKEQTTRPYQVALIGNPNTGKTTLFNALTGYRARVGNYAGVTVERRVGLLKGGAAGAGVVEIVDLPGAYSLSAHSLDELVAFSALLGCDLQGASAGGIGTTDVAPDAILMVVDASNLERNLYLFTQLAELGLPMALALNMMDEAATVGMRIDVEALRGRLGCPVLPMVAARGEGVDGVRQVLTAWAGAPAQRETPGIDGLWPEAFEGVARDVVGELEKAGVTPPWGHRALVSRALLDETGVIGGILEKLFGEAVRKALARGREAMATAGCAGAGWEAQRRYGWIRQKLAGVAVRESAAEGAVTGAGGGGRQWSERLDALTLHPVSGPLMLLATLLLVFQSIYTWSGPVMDLIDGGFGMLSELVGGALPAGPLADMLTGGVIAGVGGVLIFLPQIFILFFFIALLEDSGYLARAAFLMDRLLSRLGLSGQSFIPLLSSFACAVPGIMATRTIAHPRERLITILVAPLMSCSARLPVYTIMIGAFVPAVPVIPGVLGLQAVTLLGMYLVGVVVAMGVALVAKRLLLRQSPAPFMMELPPWRRPGMTNAFHRMWERGREFVLRAGTIILAVSILIWALSYFPRPASVEAEISVQFATAIEAAADDEEAMAAVEAELERAVAGAYLRQSALGVMGRGLEPVVMPLGWDWRIGMAVVASFPAREVVVATLGVIFDVGEADEESVDLKSKLTQATWPDGRPLFTLPVALGIMVFFALCAQCAATLAVIKRETNSWRWPVVSFVYMTGLAYVMAFAVYHGARWLGL